MDIAADITRLLKEQGASIVGFADLQGLPADVREGLPRAVAFGVALRPDVVLPIRSGPTRDYYDEYGRVNRLLDNLSKSAAASLRQLGFNAISSAATNEGVDFTTFSTRLPHKTVATRAGLGWIGKCALLITPEFGSAVRINRVLTDAPLPTTSAVDESRCGECRVCVDVCPGHAPTGKMWESGMPRAELLDAFTCRATARKLAAERTGINDSFCGMCIASCPWTKRYLRTAANAAG